MELLATRALRFIEARTTQKTIYYSEQYINTTRGLCDMIQVYHVQYGHSNITYVLTRHLQEYYMQAYLCYDIKHLISITHMPLLT